MPLLVSVLVIRHRNAQRASIENLWARACAPEYRHAHLCVSGASYVEVDLRMCAHCATRIDCLALAQIGRYQAQLSGSEGELAVSVQDYMRALNM